MREKALLALLILLAVGLVSGCGGPANGQETAEGEEEEVLAVPVEVVAVETATVFAAFNGTATLEADQEADIVAKTGGVILELLVDEGDRVEAGQVVAILDRDRLQLQLQQATATLSKLENELQRTVELHEKNLIAKDAYDRARFDLESQRAAVALNRLELSYTEVRSPISGVISERMVKVGKLVALHEALFRVDDFDPLLAVLHVPERELNTLARGQEAVLSFDAIRGESFVGRLDRLSPVIDPKTGTFKVTIEINNPDPRLKPGLFARVQIVHDVHADVATVPSDALIVEDRGTFVFRADEQGLARKTIVETGYQTNGRVEVLAGLELGQQVVTSGKGSIADETRIEIIEAAL